MSFKTILVTAFAAISLLAHVGCDSSQHQGESLGEEQQVRAEDANDVAKELKTNYAIDLNPKGGQIAPDQEAAIATSDYWTAFKASDRSIIRGKLNAFITYANRIMEIFDSKSVRAAPETITNWDDSRRTASLYLSALNEFEKTETPAPTK
jgi:hypothetical protein